MDGELEAYLRERVPEVLAGRPQVRAIAALSDEVWRVETENGRKVVVKQQLFGFLTRGKPYDLLDVEREVLGLLHGAGCPVPEVLGIDGDAQCIFLEWVGDQTLDAAIQAGDGASMRRAIAGLCAIERVLAEHAEQLSSRVVPAAGRDELAAAWAEVGTRASEGLAQLSHRLAHPFDAAGVMPLLAEMHRWLAQRPPKLGSTDYNAYNAIVDPVGAEVRFLEFAKIGWDWTERRLVQYTTSVGSGRADGRMRSLLDAETARYYAEMGGRADGARALEYHRIFFLLNGAAMLCAALDGGPRAAALLARWKKPERRLRQFAKLLARGLSIDPVAVEFRECLQDSLTPDGDRP